MPSKLEPGVVPLREGRFARFEAIAWWDQARVARSHILVIGAGALGNEVIKNLSLLGVGHLAVVDMDRVELSNLSRSVLFRESDEGKFKADCAVRSAGELYPKIRATALVGNVLSGVGLGWFRWADAVIGAVDNREARVFVNSACARVGRPWFDGGIEVLNGIVRGFFPPKTACYECTMGEVDWALLNQRRSCSLLARRAIAERGTPTTSTTASVIGAMQVQEVLKHLHGRAALLGAGFVFDGAEHGSYRVNYPVNPDCPWHDPSMPIEPMPESSGRTLLEQVWKAAERKLGGVDAIELGRELVEHASCHRCGWQQEILQPAERIPEASLICPQCRIEASPAFLHSVAADSPLLRKSVEQLGLPAWDILWARRGNQVVGFEMAADQPDAGERVHSHSAP